MIEHIRYDATAEDWLRTNPHAEEARLLIASVTRGQVPREAVTDLDQSGRSLFQLEDSGCWIWWHYEGAGREILVIDGIEEPRRP